jgi:hypothetical protein
VTGYSATNQIMTIAVDLDFKGKTTGSSTGSAAQLSMYNIKSDEKFHLNSTLNQLVGSDGYSGSAPYGGGNSAAIGFGGVAGLDLSTLASVNSDNLQVSM